MDSRTRKFGLTRRHVLAGSSAMLMMPAIVGRGFAQDKKVIRISTPANDAEWQAKGLAKFKEMVEANSPTL